jgi:ubiquinone/menaquinone biosynthesis C-methylase UbiE
MLPRVLEPEVMDTPEDAHAYDTMDHAAVNRAFVTDFLAFCPNPLNPILDVGTGTAQIPIELCRRWPQAEVVAIDAAESMLELARANVERAGLARRIRLERVDAKRLPYPTPWFGAVISNSIAHHIPEPFAVLAGMARVCLRGGAVFVRDLVRPANEAELDRLVNLHAAGANDDQRRLFADSLRAALSVDEVGAMVGRLGFPAVTVRQTSDRHWTWAAAVR